MLLWPTCLKIVDNHNRSGDSLMFTPLAPRGEWRIVGMADLTLRGPSSLPVERTLSNLAWKQNLVPLQHFTHSFPFLMWQWPRFSKCFAFDPMGFSGYTYSKLRHTDNIFWTAEAFVTKFGIMVQHHEPGVMLKDWLLSSRSRSKWGFIIIRIWLFVLHLINSWCFCIQT